MTVNEVSKLTGVSIRTLRYYDSIGLLKPSSRTDAGYRLYDDYELERLQQIMLFKELDFPLKDIVKILKSPDFDRDKALHDQIRLLELKKERLEKMIDFARGIKNIGGKAMDFSSFSKEKQKKYAAEAKIKWGNTESYKEFEQKFETRSGSDNDRIVAGLIKIFEEFGKLDKNPESIEAVALVEKLKSYITENFYTCTDVILSGLGQMYAAGGEMTENIDRFGGKGTAFFAAEAINYYCKSRI